MDIDGLRELTLLFVDDEADIRENIYSILAPFFKKIYLEKDGEEGLHIFCEHKDIDIILTDIMMPKMSGIEMVKKIRQANGDIPIIFETAFSESEMILETIKLNIIGYVLKPVDIEELLEVIERAKALIDAKKLQEKLKDINIFLQEEVAKKTKM